MTGQDRLAVWFGREYLAKGNIGPRARVSNYPHPKHQKQNKQSLIDVPSIQRQIATSSKTSTHVLHTFVKLERICVDPILMRIRHKPIFSWNLESRGVKIGFLKGTIKSVTIEIINMFCTFILSKFQCAMASYSCSIRPVSNDPSPKP